MVARTKHDGLTTLALRWLKRTASKGGPGCHIAIPEVGAIFSGERVDAFGYRWGFDGGSTVVEVKTTRNDFLADFKKPHRVNPETGIGEFRYYLCPEGVIEISDLPDKWGLIWVGARNKLTVIRGHAPIPYTITAENRGEMFSPWSFKHNTKVERDLLANLLSRVGDPEKLVKKNRADRNEINRLQDRCNNQADELKLLQKENLELKRRLAD